MLLLCHLFQSLAISVYLFTMQKQYCLKCLVNSLCCASVISLDPSEHLHRENCCIIWPTNPRMIELSSAFASESGLKFTYSLARTCLVSTCAMGNHHDHDELTDDSCFVSGEPTPGTARTKCHFVVRKRIFDRLQSRHLLQVSMWSRPVLKYFRSYILSYRSIVPSITRGCVICRKLTAQPSFQTTGQLPMERLTPGPIFDSPVQVKYGYMRKPVLTAYIFLFVSI